MTDLPGSIVGFIQARLLISPLLAIKISPQINADKHGYIET